MLKARLDNELWLVQQHHHALVSGYLAAHWGGAGAFARPGHYPGAADPARWRDEVVLAVAEHDNGWWETEAMPRISAVDGLAVGVGEAAPPTEANELGAWREGGFDRWRRGIERLAGAHPYGALLISLHAYWLYAVAFDDLAAPTHRHFVFGAPDVAESLASDRDATRAFLQELAQTQADLQGRITDDPVMARALEDDHVDAHLRLLQLFDSMSLYLSLNDTRTHELPDVPRASWSDRTTLTWRRRDARTIELDPYPFDTDGLQVPLIARVVPREAAGAQANPLSRLHGTPLRTIDFTFGSRSA